MTWVSDVPGAMARVPHRTRQIIMYIMAVYKLYIQIDRPEMLQDQQHNCLVTLVLRERNKSILYT